MEELIDDLPAVAGVVVGHDVPPNMLALKEEAAELPLTSSSPTVATLAHRLDAAAADDEDFDVHLPKADANTIPRSVSVRIAFSRWARTTAPFVAADVVSLL